MNSSEDISRDRERDRLRAEAADWFLRLSDAPEDTDLRDRFDDWLAADPRHRAHWEKVQQTYDLIGAVPPAHTDHWSSQAATRGTDGGLPTQSIALDCQVPPPKGPRRMWIAGLALIIAVVAVFATDVPMRLQADYRTESAEIRKVGLPDGSTVVLAPESALRVRVTDAGRAVDLLRGDAYFDVTPDRTRPFTVDAGAATVTVLGTSFDVRRGDENATVSVRSGAVRVEGAADRGTDGYRLSPGDRVSVGSDGVGQFSTVALSDIGLWRDGKWIAQDRTLTDVVDAYRPYFDGVIVVRSDVFETHRVSGIFDLRNPADGLKNLADAHGVTLREVLPNLIVITDR